MMADYDMAMFPLLSLLLVVLHVPHLTTAELSDKMALDLSIAVL